jgi:hypothetical protein
MVKSTAAAALFVLLATASAAAQMAPRTNGERDGERVANARRTLTAVRAITAAPIIDGVLDEAIWQAAPVATDFVQRSPDVGEPSRHRTEARVAYDGDAIYVAMRMYDSAPDSIAAQLARRDATGIFSDWADVLIDSYNDRRTAFRFSVNPAGVKKDVYHFNDQQEDIGWDAVWEAATRVDSLGWTAEFRIPLSQLRYSSSGEVTQSWGIQFGRIIARYDEMSLWSPVPPGSAGFVSLAGELSGLQGLGSPKRLEVLPYAVSKLTRAPAPAVASPFYRANAPAATIGADLKYGITSNLTLTATINPDFGQVEADPSVVNLTAFESFFPERRPFFLEGAGLFQVQIGDDNDGENLFYSRRIGRAPQRRNFDADHVRTPESSRILAAAKLTGRTADGWSIGFFDAVTEGVTARVSRDGELGSEPAEPLTNYAVGRIARDFRGGQSVIGGIVTATHRRLDDPALAFLRSSAWVGGLDWRHRFGEGGRYQFSGYLAGSAIHGDTLAIQLAQLSPARYYQRPDADHVNYDPLRTSLHGASGRFYLGRVTGAKLTGGLGGAFRTPGFEVNDAGFQTNADQHFVFLSMNYNEYNGRGIIQRWNVGVNPNAGWNFGGTRLWSQINTWGNITLRNHWSGNFFLNNTFPSTSVGALRGGPALYRGGLNRGNFNITSDRRKRVYANIGAFGTRDHDGESWQMNSWLGITARPSSRLDVSLNPSFNMNRPGWQFVATPTVRNVEGEPTGRSEYVFAALEMNTFALTTRLAYTFSPSLSLQLYAQPFLSAGRFHEFRRVADPGARAFHDRFETFTDDAIDRTPTEYRVQLAGGERISFGNPDFNVKQLRSNAVLRWEYRPGSTLFLVWSQDRNGRDLDGTFRPLRDAEQLFGLRGTNVFMVKLNYWLDL